MRTLRCTDRKTCRGPKEPLSSHWQGVNSGPCQWHFKCIKKIYNIVQLTSLYKETFKKMPVTRRSEYKSMHLNFPLTLRGITDKSIKTKNASTQISWQWVTSSSNQPFLCQRSTIVKTDEGGSAKKQRWMGCSIQQLLPPTLHKQGKTPPTRCPLYYDLPFQP